MLTALTVCVAAVIGTLQLLTLILLAASPAPGPFWDGVQRAGEHYEAIGGGICANCVVFGGLSVLCYRPWRRWVDSARDGRARGDEGVGRRGQDKPDSTS